MSDIAQEALAALLAGAKGAAAGSIGGPVGAAAGGLIGLASSLVPHVFGEDAKPALQAVAQAITGATDEAAQVEVLSSDPAAIAQFKVQALQIAADREAARDQAISDRLSARLADVQDARKTTVDLAQTKSPIAWGTPIVSGLVLGTFALMCGIVLFRAVPDGSMPLAQGLLEVFKILAVTVVAYWCGSSAGSARKDERIANMVPQPPSPGVVVPAAEVQAR